MEISPFSMWRDDNGRWQLVGLILINGRLEAIGTV